MTQDIDTSAAPLSESQISQPLSPWWRRMALLTMLLGMAVLILLTTKVYSDAPPIADKVMTAEGTIVYSGDEVRAGQLVFLKYALMDNGSIWGHGALLGPDFSAEYLHTLAGFSATHLSQQRFNKSMTELTAFERASIEAEVRIELKLNRYDPPTGVLRVNEAYAEWFELQSDAWRKYFSDPAGNGGLSSKTISDPIELRQLSAFVAWTAWASVADRPGAPHSYTNNFPYDLPYDPVAGNTPTGDALMWSALSLLFLLGGTALVLLAFGKFDYLGWKASRGFVHAAPLGSRITHAQRATLKYFALVTLLLLAQTLIGGALAHYRIDPESFYGFDLSTVLPSNLLRTWHLQLAIFWIATSYVAGALFLAAWLGGPDPAHQKTCVNVLFVALVVVVVGSLVGEWAGIRQQLPDLWFWFGHQGWEYFELGRAWQMLLAIALLFWFALLFRALRPALRDPVRRKIAQLFLCAAIAIPVFYLPAMFFDGDSHFSIVDTWRFWIIHLWVEGFFEFFVTVMVAVIYWHARSLAYTGRDLARLLEWKCLPVHAVFIVFGVVPIAIAAIRAYLFARVPRGVTEPASHVQGSL